MPHFSNTGCCAWQYGKQHSDGQGIFLVFARYVGVAFCRASVRRRENVEGSTSERRDEKGEVEPLAKRTKMISYEEEI